MFNVGDSFYCYYYNHGLISTGKKVIMMSALFEFKTQCRSPNTSVGIKPIMFKVCNEQL